MSSKLNNLTSSEQWVFAGNLIVAIGFLAVSIGQILKVAENGTMQPFFNNTTFKTKDRQLSPIENDNLFNNQCWGMYDHSR